MMKGSFMQLQRPLVVMDLETTGTWIEKDKIVEIAMVKIDPDGKKETYLKRLNPGIVIPPAVSKLIGITNEDVKSCPHFRDAAQDILAFIGHCDLAGFNANRFDFPLLERECAEAGLKFDWQNRNRYDAQKVFHLNHKRDLTAAYQFYCQKELKDAHSALADVEATLEILERQIENYGQGSHEIDVLSQFNYMTLDEYYDDEKRFRWWNGKLYLMFGKYARKASLQDVAQKDPKYLEWIVGADFSEQVKTLAADALKGRFPVRANPPQDELTVVEGA